ncbi:AAA family ATPase [Streptomyces sp. TRM43335]|uniref:AAA family ATPase n=1 Tax=Streptomyces taklimakanensis TaxID=2569853 RepID=A0A6G2BK25_9ACTN|nr:AAA family ATPase [Streptomyces taklimakanensis]MTE22600.1 AAA family ATPase [Streptomyces taklimakanensis]
MTTPPGEPGGPAEGSRIALPPLETPDRLEVVAAWPVDAPYQAWRPQVLVPGTHTPGRPPRTFAVVNQKGGAGKTTTAVELAAAWAADGYRVRVIDADPQEAALSAWLRPQHPEGEEPRSLRSVFFEECTLAEATYPTRFEGIDVVPSGLDLARVEYERPVGAEKAVAAALAEDAEDAGSARYDVTLIDSAPSLGLVTVAALAAADEAVVPLRVGGLDVMGMASLHKTIRSVQRMLNPKLRVGMVLLTAWDKSGLARQLSERVAEDYPEVPVVPVRRSVRASEAPAAGEPVRSWAPESTVASDYAQAAGLLLAREGAA